MANRSWRAGWAELLLVTIGAYAPLAAYGATIEVDTVRAATGEQVQVVGILRSDGVALSGAQVDFSFPPGAPVVVHDTGTRLRPECVNRCNEDYAPPPWFDVDDGGGGAAKACTSGGFAFLPAGCTPGVDCTGVRALIISLHNVDPFPDPAYLFVCTLAVAPDAPLGTYPLTCRNPEAATPNGILVPVICLDGAIDVLCPGDCNGDARVTVSELVTGIHVFQGEVDGDACPSSDIDGDGETAVTELVRARNTLLDGCRP